MDNVRLLSYLKVRQAIGWLGILLPLILIVGGSLAGHDILPSISDYYYSNMGTTFTGILFMVATFLFTYKGYNNQYTVFWGLLNDNQITTLAAVFALIVALFPCGSIASECYGILIPTVQSVVNTIHFIAAGILFTLLGIISYYFFTASQKPKSEIVGTPKAARNKLYKSCAYIIWSCIALMLIIKVGKLAEHTNGLIRYYIFIGEIICLFAFGLSWLVKGDMLLKDKKEN